MTQLAKRRLGFCLQEDVLFSQLTVRESLQYALPPPSSLFPPACLTLTLSLFSFHSYQALLRLPRTWSKDSKIARYSPPPPSSLLPHPSLITLTHHSPSLTLSFSLCSAEEMLDILGLVDCADSLVGSAMTRGISGGEKKRLSIALEMLSSPEILLLDEPTSGLDAATALSLIVELGRLASLGKTVVATLHQPNSNAFASFDQLLILDQGQSVYFGAAADAAAYSEDRLQLPIPVHFNPADFWLYTVAEAANEKGSDIHAIWAEYAAETEIYQAGRAAAAVATAREKEEDRLYLLQSDTERKEHDVEAGQDADAAGDRHGPKWNASWALQFKVLCLRALKQQRGDVLTVLNFAQIIAIGLIMGLIWFRLDATDATMSARAGGLFFVCVFWSFHPLFHAAQLFPVERVSIKKERAAGVYRLSAYFLAKTAAEAPLQALLPSIFLPIFYVMADLNPTVHNFFICLAIVLCIVLAGQSAGLLAGTLIMDMKKVLVIASTTLLGFSLIGGFYVQERCAPSRNRHRTVSP